MLRLYFPPQVWILYSDSDPSSGGEPVVQVETLVEVHHQTQTKVRSRQERSGLQVMSSVERVAVPVCRAGAHTEHSIKNKVSKPLVAIVHAQVTGTCVC